MKKEIQAAVEQFEKLLENQLARVEKIKSEKDFMDYSALDKIIIGIVGGDGIGPAITNEGPSLDNTASR